MGAIRRHRVRREAEQRRREYQLRARMGEPPMRAAQVLQLRPRESTLPARPVLKLVAGGTTAARRPAIYIYGRNPED